VHTFLTNVVTQVQGKAGAAGVAGIIGIRDRPVVRFGLRRGLHGAPRTAILRRRRRPGPIWKTGPVRLLTTLRRLSSCS